MRDRDPAGRRVGFAVPLAVVLLITVALLASLLLDAALGQLRAGTAAAAESRVAVAVESALASALAVRLDTTVLSLPRGAVAYSDVHVAAESVRVSLRVAHPGIARLQVSATSGTGRVRVFAGRAALLAFVRDTVVTGEVALRPLGPNWWIALP